MTARWEYCSVGRREVKSAPSPPPGNHMSGPLDTGDREGDTVVCPWHKSRFDLCSGEAIDGPAVFPQSRYHTRVRDGNIEIKAAAEKSRRRYVGDFSQKSLSE